MSWLRQTVRELWGLFVEDGSFALAILLWVAVTVFILPRFVSGNWRGLVAFFGLAAILIENVLRTAKRLPPRSKPTEPRA
jgi:hypothetical protein